MGHVCGVGNLPRQAPERFALTAGSTQDLPRNVPVAIEICLAEGKPAAQRQNYLREPVSQGFWSRPVGQPGRLQRPIWTPLSTAQEAGSREPAGQPGSSRDLYSPGGRLQRPNRTAREAPGSQLNSPGGSRRPSKETCATRFLRPSRRFGVMHSKGKLPLARALSCPRG